MQFRQMKHFRSVQESNFKKSPIRENQNLAKLFNSTRQVEASPSQKHNTRTIKRSSPGRSNDTLSYINAYKNRPEASGSYNNTSDNTRRSLGRGTSRNVLSFKGTGIDSVQLHIPTEDS